MNDYDGWEILIVIGAIYIAFLLFLFNIKISKMKKILAALIIGGEIGFVVGTLLLLVPLLVVFIVIIATLVAALTWASETLS